MHEKSHPLSRLFISSVAVVVALIAIGEWLTGYGEKSPLPRRILDVLEPPLRQYGELRSYVLCHLLSVLLVCLFAFLIYFLALRCVALFYYNFLIPKLNNRIKGFSYEWQPTRFSLEQVLLKKLADCHRAEKTNEKN